jgi:hypothetical protein
VSFNRLRFMAVAGWFAILGAVLITRLTLDIPSTLAGTVIVALLGGILTIVMLAVFRGAGPRNVTQMLYDVDREPSRTPSPDAPADTIDPVPGDSRD